MSFNPQQHIIKLQGRDYLPVMARVAWYRETFPHGKIDTDFILLGDLVIAKTVVTDNEGNFIASGSATVRDASERERAWTGRIVEKAETAAIGRALANAGFGTLTADDEGDYLADSPQQSKPKQAPKQQDKPATPQDWENELISLTTPLFKARDHAKNAINGLLQNKIIVKGQALNEAAAAVFLNRALKEYEADEAILHMVLGKHPKDFKQTPDAFAKAWELLAKSSKQANE